LAIYSAAALVLLLLLLVRLLLLIVLLLVLAVVSDSALLVVLLLLLEVLVLARLVVSLVISAEVGEEKPAVLLDRGEVTEPILDPPAEPNPDTREEFVLPLLLLRENGPEANAVDPGDCWLR